MFKRKGEQKTHGKEAGNNLVTVLSTGNQAEISVAKTVLESAGIKYLVKGEGLQELFGYARLGAGFNLVVGPIEIQVLQRDAEEAKKLLEGSS